jgi:glycosyltransferase involved in cell wall biosynthesis
MQQIPAVFLHLRSPRDSMTPASPPSRQKILFLPRWYPDRSDPMPGLFIQRHAEAIASVAEVAVVFVKSLPALPSRFEIETSHENGVLTIRTYFRGKEKSSGGYNGLFFVIAFIKAMLQMRKSFGNPGIIHVHVLTRLGVLAWCYKMLTGTPYLITEHWSRYLPAVDTYKGFWRKMATRFVVKHAEAITTVTQNLRDAMQSKGLDNPNYHVIYNVADTRYFHPDDPPVRSGLKQFIHISCFEDRSKNISGLLRAIAALTAIRQDFVCHLAGEGADLEPMRAYALELGIFNKTVLFRGLLEGEAIAAALRQSRFLVLFSNYENMPVVINEAFASGIPVVATRVGGIAEHVDLQKGMLVDAGDEKGLVNALSEMLDQSDIYDSKAIRQYAVDNFSIQAVAEKFNSVYSAIAAKHYPVTS